MKLTQIKRTVTISNPTYSAGDWTWTTSAAHYLAVGDTFQYRGPGGDIRTLTTITGTTGSTIKFTLANPNFQAPTSIDLENFGTSCAETPTFQFSYANNIANGLVHFVSNGTATTTVKLQGSLDNIHWIDIGTATAITSNSQFEVNVTKPYVHGKITFTVAPASAGGGANTIKIYRAGC